MGRKTTVLMILDGFGINARTEGNAIKQAETPNLDRLMEKYPYELGTPAEWTWGSRKADGQFRGGAPEHRRGKDRLSGIHPDKQSHRRRDFFGNPVLLSAMENCKSQNAALHIMGLVSDGGVHSHNTHLYALLKNGEGA